MSAENWPPAPGDAELEAYLDEALPAPAMADIESRLRDDPALLDRLAAINLRRDAGVHSLGAIWRRQRLSCPSRQQWGNFLLGTLATAEADYFRLHLELAGCRCCQANLEDLRRQQAVETTATAQRRRKYFQSSAGHLRSEL